MSGSQPSRCESSAAARSGLVVLLIADRACQSPSASSRRRCPGSRVAAAPVNFGASAMRPRPWEPMAQDCVQERDYTCNLFCSIMISLPWTRNDVASSSRRDRRSASYAPWKKTTSVVSKLFYIFHRCSIPLRCSNLSLRWLGRPELRRLPAKVSRSEADVATMQASMQLSRRGSIARRFERSAFR
jgi:hypothetical protein